MLHMISAQCVPWDLHMIMPWPLQRMCSRRFVAQWGDCKSLELHLSIWLSLVLLLLSILRHEMNLSHQSQVHHEQPSSRFFSSPQNNDYLVGRCFLQGWGAITADVWASNLLCLYYQMGLEVSLQGPAHVARSLTHGKHLVITEVWVPILHIQDLQGADLQVDQQAQITCRSSSDTVYHVCDLMLTALWCILEIEKSIFWSERIDVHNSIMVESGMNQYVAKYYKPYCNYKYDSGNQLTLSMSCCSFWVTQPVLKIHDQMLSQVTLVNISFCSYSLLLESVFHT